MRINWQLESRRELADAVRQTDRILMPVLQEHSQTARALWDVGQDQRTRDVLTLAITDPWGYAADDLALDELTNQEHLRLLRNGQNVTCSQISRLR